MTRAVVDSNVYVSALVFGGVPQQVLDVIFSLDCSLYTSPSIVDEVTGTLAVKFNWTPGEIKEFLPPLWERCVLIRPTFRLMLCRDPDDNRILECAAAAKANFLITGNAKHFPKSHKGTKVISPRQFLELFPS